MENKKVIAMSFKIDEGLKKLLDECAKETRQSTSRFIREAIIEKIDKVKRER